MFKAYSITMVAFSVLTACGGVKSGSGLADSVQKISMDDYYAGYQGIWQTKEKAIMEGFTKLRLQTFASYFKSIKAAQKATIVKIGDVTIAPKAGDLAEAEQVFSDLGKKYATLGEFFDATGIKPRMLSRSEMETSLRATASHGTAELGLVASYTQCGSYFQKVDDKAIQAQMLDPALDTATGGGSGNYAQRLYSKAQTALKPQAFAAFSNFMSNSCATTVRENQLARGVKVNPPTSNSLPYNKPVEIGAVGEQ